MMKAKFYVVAVAAALLLALSVPSLAAKRTPATKHAVHATESPRFGNSSSAIRRYDRDDPYAPGVNWPGHW